MNEWTGTFELINPRDVVVDHRYQREEKPALIAKIAAAPDWAAFGALSCYKRGGLYFCFDGQQRLRGILSSPTPPKLVPAIIHAAAPLDVEASAFVKVNVDRKAVDPLEKHRGQLVAKDPVALALERAVEKAGFTIGYSGDSRSVSAIATLHYAYNLLGEAGLTQVLVQVREAWPDDRAATSTNILRGLADVIAGMNGNYQRQKVTASLSRTSPALILRKAEELRFDLGGSKQINVRRAFKALAKV